MQYVKVYKNLKAHADRHGKMRYYYRVRGHKLIPIYGQPGTKTFDQSYDEAAEIASKPAPIGASSIIRGSVNDLIACYYQSAEFNSLKPITQKGYRYMLERFRNKFGKIMVRSIDQGHLNAIKDALSDKPGIARPLLKRLSTLFKFAIERKFRADNPVAGIKLPKQGKGWRPLTDDDIATYEAYWPSGSVQRLTMALLLYTGQRRLDVIAMGRQHVRNGRISVAQEKTGIRLEIKIHPALQAELDQIPADQMLFLTNNGQPLKPNRFTDSFRKWCIEAGLPNNSSPHSVRKASGRRLAEAGSSSKQIMAILGHKTMSEAEKYVADADQIRLADDAIDKLSQPVPEATPEPAPIVPQTPANDDGGTEPKPDLSNG